ncbi:MAG TPA: neutral zinc metallopeptidase [Steroidobacteraceae bacterium]|nr:neutral zinc metallopeptidase [Steroidobacteraceae bacterium]
MRWREGRRSDNVEDMRGRGMGGGAKFGIGTLVVMAAAYFLGVDPSLLMGIMEGGGTQEPAPTVSSGQPLDEGADFLRVVLADTEDTWGALFQQAGSTYQPPTLRLFSGGTVSGCGSASSAAGPFYCPSDQRVYIDLDFFGELVRRFDAPGDSAAPGSFAQAYVLAHEVGHHVQHLMGLDEKVRGAQQRSSQEQQNALQVRMELQADCFAGIWAHHAQRARQIIEAGDIEDALGAAAAVGDDMIQKRTQGHVVPESFTHGTAAQRQQWFERGFQSGQVDSCDTFGTRSL